MVLIEYIDKSRSPCAVSCPRSSMTSDNFPMFSSNIGFQSTSGQPQHDLGAYSFAFDSTTATGCSHRKLQEILNLGDSNLANSSTTMSNISQDHIPYTLAAQPAIFSSYNTGYEDLKRCAGS